MTRTPSPIQIGVVGLAVLLAVAIFVVAVTVDRSGDAPLFLFAVPLALAAVGWGLRGGVALGLLTSLLAAAWWVEESYPGGGAWISARVITCLLIGVLLGWFAESRHQLMRAIALHRERSLDLIATANFEGYFTEVNPAFTRTLGFTSEELLSRRSSPSSTPMMSNPPSQPSPSRPIRDATSSTSRTGIERRTGPFAGSNGARAQTRKVAR